MRAVDRESVSVDCPIGILESQEADHLLVLLLPPLGLCTGTEGRKRARSSDLHGELEPFGNIYPKEKREPTGETRPQNIARCKICRGVEGDRERRAPVPGRTRQRRGARRGGGRGMPARRRTVRWKKQWRDVPRQAKTSPRAARWKKKTVDGVRRGTSACSGREERRERSRITGKQTRPGALVGSLFEHNGR